MKSQEELQKLQEIASDSWYCRGVNSDMVRYSYQIFSRFILPGSILEMGPAEGVMTELLATRHQPMTLVEGAGSFCEDLRRRFPKAEVVHSLFEDFQTDKKFDNIILGHVLEHVDDAVATLKYARQWLAPGGRILTAVPNARSLHRQAAVIMGLLPFEEAMNEADIHHGHRRIFNPETFRNAFFQSGLSVEIFGGYWIKPVSNKQIEESWTPQMLDAFMKLGERYPDIAAEIYVIARHPAHA